MQVRRKSGFEEKAATISWTDTKYLELQNIENCAVDQSKISRYIQKCPFLDFLVHSWGRRGGVAVLQI